jgi:hypothetical protein
MPAGQTIGGACLRSGANRERAVCVIGRSQAAGDAGGWLEHGVFTLDLDPVMLW